MAPSVKYVLVMTFIGVVLGVSLYNSDVNILPSIGIWAFVVFGFGTYLYFGMFRSRPKDPEDEDPEDENLEE